MTANPYLIEGPALISFSGANGDRFNKRRTYAEMVNELATSPLLNLEDGDDDEFDAECGLTCSGEE